MKHTPDLGPKKTLIVPIKAEAHARLRELSATTETPMAELVRQAIDRLLSENQEAAA